MKLDISSYAITMAKYNQWMNGNLYLAAGQINEGNLKSDQGLFFGSIFSTLNHLLVCDLMWLARFNGEPVKVRSLTQELFEDFEKMRQARKKTDLDIISWADSLASLSLSNRLHYKSLGNKTDRDMDFANAIVHFFNHQTHHRGQVTAAFSQHKIDYGVTDLIFMPEEK